MTPEDHVVGCARRLQSAAGVAFDGATTNDKEASVAHDLTPEHLTGAHAHEPMARAAGASPRRGSSSRRWQQRIGMPAALLLLLSAGACAPTSDDSPPATDRNGPVASASSSQAAKRAPSDGTLRMTVHKTPTCGCCRAWVDHLRAQGFHVETVDRDDLTMVKAANGVPGGLQSCHTATVGGYVVEGHVPAGDIRRLLAERPAVAGIAVPGMPVGSPGMEVPGTPTERYDVVSFDRAGATQVFASH